jgi:hypothetical protein
MFRLSRQCGRPLQKELVRVIPALLAVRDGTNVSPDAPLVVHGFLPDETTHREDSPSRVALAVAGTPRTATRSTASGRSGSSRICHL